jgi:hypothetical protein
MITRPAVLLAAVAATAFLACLEAPTAPFAVTLQLDRDTYVAVPMETTATYGVRYGVRLIVHYQNRTGGSIYFERCGETDSSPIYHIPTADGVSDSGWAVGWACPGASVLEFPPFAVRTDTLLIRGPSAYDGVTHEPLGVLTGSFRLEYETRLSAANASSCYRCGPRVASGPFEVRLP